MVCFQAKTRQEKVNDLVSRTGQLTIANKNEASPVSAGLAVRLLFAVILSWSVPIAPQRYAKAIAVLCSRIAILYNAVDMQPYASPTRL